MKELNEEVSRKLELIREALTETEAIGIRLKGTDWFAWATAGASNTVLLTAETGVAEVLVTAQDAWVLTDEIEAQRLKDEELPANFQVNVNPWADAAARESFVREATNEGKVISDRPIPHIEKRLPASLQQHKRAMMSSDLERYREVGRKASEAMTEVLTSAKPTWTEYQLAGAGAEAEGFAGAAATGAAGVSITAGTRWAGGSAFTNLNCAWGWPSSPSLVCSRV